MIRINWKLILLFFLNKFVNNLFFELKPDYPTCFIEEFIEENVNFLLNKAILIKYKLYDLNLEDSISKFITDEIDLKLSKSISIEITTETNEITGKIVLSQLKGKHSLITHKSVLIVI